MGRVSRYASILTLAIFFWFWSADLSQESQDVFYTVMDACELYWGLHLEEGRAQEAVAKFMEQHGDSSDHLCWVMLESSEDGRGLGITKWELWLAETSVWRRMALLVLTGVLVLMTPAWYAYRSEQ